MCEDNLLESAAYSLFQIFGHGHLCPRYSEVFYQEINKTTESLKEQGEVQELFPYCEAHCGENLKTVADLGLLVDALKSEVSTPLIIRLKSEAEVGTIGISFVER